MFNRIVLVGRLATCVELRYTPSGIAVAAFRVAVDRSYTNAAGEREVDTWIVKVWRKQAETCANWLTKGRMVLVEGSIESHSRIAQDGTKRSVTEIVAEHVQFLPGGRDVAIKDGVSARSTAPTTAKATAPQTARAAHMTAPPSHDVPDLDDPFAGLE